MELYSQASSQQVWLQNYVVTVLEAPPEYLNGPRTAIASSLRGEGIHRAVVVSQVRYRAHKGTLSIRSFALKQGKWLLTKPFIPMESRHSVEPMTLVRSRSNPNVVYSVRRNVLMRSSDGGSTWKEVTLRVNGLLLSQFVRTVSGIAPAEVDTKIAAIHPTNPSIVFASFVGWRATDANRVRHFNVPGLYSSNDGGENWSLLSSVLAPYDIGNDLFPVLGISPSNPAVMLGRSDQGLVLTKDGGRNWAAVGQQRELEMSVEIAGRAGAVEKARKLGLHPAEKLSWNKLDVYQVEFGSNDDKVIYLGTSRGIYKSLDLGGTWRLLDVPVRTFSGTNSFVTNRDNPLDLLVGSIDGAYLAIDGGCHFEKIY